MYNSAMDKNRLKELAERSSNKNIFVFTDFLNEREQTELKREYPTSFVSFWGGAEFSERKMARFGNSDVACKENFPLQVIRICPKGGRFSAPMSHRDVLGAITALGIVREKIGDIFVKDDKCAAVVHKNIADYIIQNLVGVGRNNVAVYTENSVDECLAPKKEIRRFSAQSNRLDAIVCKTFCLSRDKACELAAADRIFINGIVCGKTSRALKTGETVSVRGYGKFVFCGEDGRGRKGKTYFRIEIYV